MNIIEREAEPFEIRFENKKPKYVYVEINNDPILKYITFSFKHSLLEIFIRYKEMKNIDIELKTFKKKPFYAEIILKKNPTFLKNAHVAFSRRIS